MTPYITYIILAITGLVSYQAFQDGGLKWKFMFNAYQVKHRNEWYRLFSHGLIHADWTHLGLNMLTLYFFGSQVESEFVRMFGQTEGEIKFLALYVISLAGSSMYNMPKNQDNPGYNALGASGAVAGVLYAAILMDPWGKIYLYFTLPIPAVVFGVLYLVYSNYMAKKQLDNIGHDAHFWGAVFGFVTALVFKPTLLREFIEDLL